MKTEMSHAIETLVDFVFPRGQKREENEVLHVCVNANYSIYEENETLDARKQIHFLFSRPYNYTKVLMFVSDGPVSLKDIPADAWELKSNHDSGWHNDGIQNPLFNIHCELQDSLNKDNWNKIRSHNTFDLFSQPRLISAKLELIRNEDKYPQKYRVTLLNNT